MEVPLYLASKEAKYWGPNVCQIKLSPLKSVDSPAGSNRAKSRVGPAWSVTLGRLSKKNHTHRHLLEDPDPHPALGTAPLPPPGLPPRRLPGRRRSFSPTAPPPGFPPCRPFSSPTMPPLFFPHRAIPFPPPSPLGRRRRCSIRGKLLRRAGRAEAGREWAAGRRRRFDWDLVPAPRIASPPDFWASGLAEVEKGTATAFCELWRRGIDGLDEWRCSMPLISTPASSLLAVVLPHKCSNAQQTGLGDVGARTRGHRGRSARTRGCRRREHQGPSVVMVLRASLAQEPNMEGKNVLAPVTVALLQ